MSKYGITYQGSKDSIADKIMSVIPSGKRFVDLFGGGFAMSHCALLSGKFESVLYNELNTLLFNLIKDAVSGKYNYNKFMPEWIDREKFQELKDKDGYIKYLWSFGSGGEDYIFGKDIENYKKDLHNAVVFNDFSGSSFVKYPQLKNIKGKNIQEKRFSARKIIKESIPCIKRNGHCYDLDTGKNIEQLQQLQPLQQLERLQQLEGLERIEFYNCDYRSIELKDGDIVYCDPPYANTASYNKNAFNHDEFWQWVRGCKNIVFVSEFSAPDDFQPILSIKKRGLMAGGKQKEHKLENLYCNKKININDLKQQGVLF